MAKITETAHSESYWTLLTKEYVRCNLTFYKVYYFTFKFLTKYILNILNCSTLSSYKPLNMADFIPMRVIYLAILGILGSAIIMASYSEKISKD